jgi:ribosomal protein S18 acetylase RimI-like enzyme
LDGKATASSVIELREGTLREAPLLAQMFRQMWLDIGMAETHIVKDAEARVVRFIEEGQRRHSLRMFFAVQNGADIGGAACQRFAGLYPDLLMPEVRRYGYLWGVYVVSEARRAGVGEALTSRCVEALREDGCTHALLHAAPMGAGVYERLGFQPNVEMRLTL